MFLVGNQQHMLDDKNRIRLPAKYREELGNKYLIMPGTHGCIYIYPADETQKLMRTIQEMDTFDPQRAEWIRSITEFSAMADADGQGRFMLPQELLDICGIKKNVRIVGAISKVEVWSEERYQERRNRMNLTVEGFDNLYSHLHGNAEK